MYPLHIHMTILYVVFVGGAQLASKQREDNGSCPPHYYYNATVKECKLCPNGFIGINCSEKCMNGFHGKGCQKKCPNNCKTTCHRVTGKCPHQVTDTQWTTRLLDSAYTSTYESKSRPIPSTDNIQNQEASLEKDHRTILEGYHHTTHTASIEMLNKLPREGKSSFPVVIPIVCFGSILVGILFSMLMLHLIRMYKAYSRPLLEEVDVQTQTNQVYDQIDEEFMVMNFSKGGCNPV